MSPTVALRPGFRVRTAGIFTAVSLAVALGGAATANAETEVAGVRLATTVLCKPSVGFRGLEVEPQSNSMTAATYAMVYMSEYLGNNSWSPWVHENTWHRFLYKNTTSFAAGFNFTSSGH